MGNLLGKNKKHESHKQHSRSDGEKGGRISSSNFHTQNQKSMSLPLPPPPPPVASSSMSKKSSLGKQDSGQSSKAMKPSKKYDFIPDNFTTLEQVCFSP